MSRARPSNVPFAAVAVFYICAVGIAFFNASEQAPHQTALLAVFQLGGMSTVSLFAESQSRAHGHNRGRRRRFLGWTLLANLISVGLGTWLGRGVG